MTTPDFGRFEKMVAWAHDELDPYIAELIPNYTTAMMSLVLDQSMSTLHGRDLRAWNANSDMEPLGEPELDAFGALCAQIIGHFDKDHLLTPPKSTTTRNGGYKVLQISHHFQANNRSDVWG